MKIIYIEIDDELSNLLDKIKQSTEKDIYIVIPKRSSIAFSIINFKILKKLAESLCKHLFVVSVDKRIKFLSSLVGLSVIDKVSVSEDKKNVMLENDEPELEILEEIKKEKSKQKDKEISIEQMDYDNEVSQKLKSVIYDESVIYPQKRYAVFLFAFLSVALLVMIFYFALPHTKIYITPKYDVTEYSTNVILSDEMTILNDQSEIATNVVPYKLDTVSVDKTSVYPATGEIYEGKRSRGEVTLYNKTAQTKEFVRSRFMTDDGLIFWSLGSVKIPPNSRVTITLEATDVDNKGKVIGERGNIPVGKKLSMPAIPSLSPSMIYAEVKKPFEGGTTVVIKYVSKEDIEVAKKNITQELLDKSVKDIQDMIAQKNKEFNSEQIFLVEPKTYQYKVSQLDIPPGIVNKRVNDFSVYAKMSFSGVSYDRKKLLSILKDGIQKKINPDMILQRIEENKISMYPVDINMERKFVKMESTIRAKSAYDFTPNTITGVKLRQRIRDLVSGKPQEEAMKLLKNVSEIDEIEIVNWPFWNDNVAAMDSQIDIILRE